ncbi:hypothetical protein ACLB2K_014470 [Fragaria x ananassa]
MNYVLQIKWRKIPSFEKEMKKLKRFPHQYLKVVKFCGFIGYGNEMELAAYLIENAMVLEKIIIEPTKKSFHFGQVLVGQKIRTLRSQQRSERAL